MSVHCKGIGPDPLSGENERPVETTKSFARMERSGILGTVIVPLALWNDLMEIGRRRTEGKRLYNSSEYLHPKAHEMGVVGEWRVATLLGQPYATDVSTFGDDGYDLPGNIDVKCSESFKYPWLKVRVEKAVPGRRFALVAMDFSRRAVRYVGYITSEELQRICKPERIVLRPSRATEITGLKRDEKLGPESYVLRDVSVLTRALPPID
jgi:hypothetical protein